MTRSSGLKWRSLAYTALIVAIPVALSGCAVGNLSNPFNRNDSADAPPLPPSTLPQNVTGSQAAPQSGMPAPPLAPVAPAAPSQTSAAAAVPSSNPGLATLPSGEAANCPEVVSWPQDRLVTVYQPGHTGEAMAIRHRGELTQLSRECRVYGNRMTVRYGIAGRVLLGPKGSAGTVSLPISIRVADASQRIIQSNAIRVSASVPSGNPVGYFSTVQEVSFPVTMGTRPQDYKIYVGLKQT
ncbi:hypothetical protein A7A08_01993 [Methyloligella halotolerans]|uniref:Uncharacterized protein n=1 Tax=Methyloligella halotolerans TaxID=1177755 RepID=A0A1E2RYC7_9HYPH|nr:hypothetical protein [Methyloligella halotolerans]ODA67246.1 hypothetical protein A7A08_01993 [Methyloligella halotolerans]